MSTDHSETIKISCVVKDGFLPEYRSRDAAGADLKADIQEDLILGPGERRLVPTGLRIAIPEGYEGQIRPRSGLAVNHGITLLNAPGTIDSDYRGEIMVIVINHSDEEYVIHSGDRIAQLVISSVVIGLFEPGDAIAASKRGEGGFGSTGE